MRVAHSNSKPRVPGWLILLLVLVLAGTAVLVLMALQRDGEPLPTVTSTTTMPAPTPDAAPIEFPVETALLAQIPDTVRQYVLADTAEGERTDGATEAWQLTYRSSGGEVVLWLTQWGTSETAAQNQESFANDVEDASKEDLGSVVAQGQEVGQARLWKWPDGQGRLVWQNNSVLLRLDGPAEELVNSYRAFPM